MIQRESLVDIAIKRIKQHISSGSWQPGDKYLSEKELIQNLQVSRTVVREALITLQSIGIIKIISGEGVYIADAEVDPIKEILKHYDDVHGVKARELAEIRKVIELGAIRLIIEKNNTVDIPRLVQLNENYRQAIQQGKDTREADRLFHQALIKATANDTFYHFSEIIQEYFALTKIDVLLNDQALLQSYQEHQAIIRAIEEQEMVEAQSIMIQHLEPVLIFTKHMEDVELNETHPSQ